MAWVGMFLKQCWKISLGIFNRTFRSLGIFVIIRKQVELREWVTPEGATEGTWRLDFIPEEVNLSYKGQSLLQELSFHVSKERSKEKG